MMHLILENLVGITWKNLLGKTTNEFSDNSKLGNDGLSKDTISHIEREIMVSFLYNALI